MKSYRRKFVYFHHHHNVIKKYNVSLGQTGDFVFYQRIHKRSTKFVSTENVCNLNKQRERFASHTNLVFLDFVIKVFVNYADHEPFILKLISHCDDIKIMSADCADQKTCKSHNNFLLKISFCFDVHNTNCVDINDREIAHAHFWKDENMTTDRSTIKEKTICLVNTTCEKKNPQRI